MIHPNQSDDQRRSEQLHYERIAALHALEIEKTGMVSGSAALPPFLRAPYVDYATAIRASCNPGTLVVDIAAGTGVHSLAAGPRVDILATDISSSSLALARQRSGTAGVPLLLTVADGNILPLRNSSAGLVTSAGSLYCFDVRSLQREVVRVLSPGGAWIIVDSFRHNPLYFANRVVGYLRGRRTRLAVTNVPGRGTLRMLRETFEEVSVRYYGMFSFLGPGVSKVLGPVRAGKLLDLLDQKAQWVGILAFKVVVVAKSPRNSESGRAHVPGR